MHVLVARHGEAAYETDLCTDDGGSLTGLGRQQSRDLAERLQGERISRVWSSSLSRAVQTAEIVAAALGVEVDVREGLREYGVGSLAGTDGDEAAVILPVVQAWIEGDDDATIPGGETISGIVARVQAVLEEAVEAHPGEAAVLVVTHGGAMMATLPQLVGLPRGSALGVSIPNCAVIGLEKDADGWRLVSGSLGPALRPSS